MKSWIERIKRSVKAESSLVLRISLLYVLALTALMQADYYYKDDLRRTLNGNMWWDRQSRYLSNLVSTLLSMDTHIGNLSPLTQIIGAVIMAAGAVILIRLFYGSRKPSVPVYFACIPFALSPYFLECFSFQFDIPFMALSVFFCIVPFAFADCKRRTFALVSFLGVLGMLLTYQASSGIYPMIAAFIFLRRINRGEGKLKDNLYFCLTGALSYAAALAFYMAFLLHPYKNYKSIKMLPISRLIPGVIGNYLKFYKNVYHDFKKLWLVLFLCAVVLFWFGSVFRSVQKKWVSFLLTGAVLAFGSVMAYGIYIAMDQPAYNPRMMYGFGVLLTIMFLHMCAEERNYPGKTVCILLGWCFFSFSFLFGNALAEQKRFNEISMNRVVSVLDTLDVFRSDTVKKVALEGNFGTSPAVQDMEKGYKMLSRLIPSSKATYQWEKYYFFGYLGLPDIKPASSKDDLHAMNLPVLAETAYCTVSGDEEWLLIEIRDQNIIDLM